MRSENVVVNDILTRAEERIYGITGNKVVLFAQQVTDESALSSQQQAVNLISSCCLLWGINREELKQKDRTQPLPTQRSLVSLLLRNNFKKAVSSTFIADQLGYNEHSSIVHGANSAKGYLKSNDEYFLRYYNKIKHLFNI
jgi:chromosomal replication initiation ATPase DnaA